MAVLRLLKTYCDSVFRFTIFLNPESRNPQEISEMEKKVAPLFYMPSLKQF